MGTQELSGVSTLQGWLEMRSALCAHVEATMQAGCSFAVENRFIDRVLRPPCSESQGVRSVKIQERGAAEALMSWSKIGRINQCCPNHPRSFFLTERASLPAHLSCRAAYHRGFEDRWIAGPGHSRGYAYPWDLRAGRKKPRL